MSTTVNIFWHVSYRVSQLHQVEEFTFLFNRLQWMIATDDAHCEGNRLPPTCLHVLVFAIRRNLTWLLGYKKFHRTRRKALVHSLKFNKSIAKRPRFILFFELWQKFKLSYYSKFTTLTLEGQSGLICPIFVFKYNNLMYIQMLTLKITWR